jgi:hypothetical protein
MRAKVREFIKRAVVAIYCHGVMPRWFVDLLFKALKLKHL